MVIDWNDIQGITVRGNHFPRSWHLFYAFPSALAGKEFLKWIRPLVSTAVRLPDDQSPDWLTYVGLTYPGLRKLEAEPLLKKFDPELTLRENVHWTNPFPSEFIDGPEHSELGDTHPDDVSAGWWNGRFRTNAIHGSMHIYCRTELAAQQRLADVRAQFELLDIEELNPNGPGTLPLAGQALEDRRRVHFGYIDGIAQPDVDWENESPESGKVDRRHFLLGYGGPIPSAPSFARTGALFRNATYLAFRWMSQDVPAFEKFLTDSAPLLKDAYPTATNLRELLAAKLVGRWRSGVSLLESAVNESPSLQPSDSFSYEGSDPDGLQCPFSAHVRASNPRDQKLNPIVAEVPRLIRRGMVYGSPWQQGVNDDEDRGLYGMFLCASLERQFQMIMRWINVNDFSPKFSGVIPASQDPLFGARGLANKRPTFRIPIVGGVVEIPLPDKAFVRSRGTVYLLMPGLTTLTQLIASE